MNSLQIWIQSEQNFRNKVIALHNEGRSVEHITNRLWEMSFPNRPFGNETNDEAVYESLHTDVIFVIEEASS